MKFTGRIREPEKLTASFPALKLPLSGGYEEGYADGRTDGYTEGEQAARAEAVAHNAAILTDCNAVLPDKGVKTADTLEQVPQRIEEIQSYSDGYDVGFEDGKQAEREYFGDNYQAAGDDWQYAFGGRAWNDATFNPTKDLIIKKTANYLFFNSNIRNLKQILQRNGVVLDTSLVTSNYNFARNAAIQYFPHIDFSNCAKLDSSWAYCGSMVELSISIKEKVQCVTPFVGCHNLINLTIVSGTFGTSLSFADSPLLSDASVQSIIDALADLTGTTAQTLIFHRNVYDILTEEQKATVAAKNWTLVRA